MGRPLQATAIANGAGVATASLTPTRQQQWKVSQVSTEMPAAVGTTTCGLYLNGYLVSPMLARGSAAAGDPPVDLGPSDTLQVRWDNVAPGSVGKVLWFYDEVPYA